MTVRRCLLALVLLAAVSHVFGIARTLLPAQDGLKFLRIAREFQLRPWADVIRGSDQHPLYPAMVALVEPPLAAIAGHGPDTWRLAAQVVATLAALALLAPLYVLTRALFDHRIALLAVFLYLLLPLPAAIGHDTLSDSLALFAALSALALGEIALRSTGWLAPVGCGIVAGLGYLARPEVVIVPFAVLITAATRWGWSALALRAIPVSAGTVHDELVMDDGPHSGPYEEARRASGARSNAMPRLAAVALTSLLLVGSYALIKGEVSEKLALRRGAALSPHTFMTRKAGQWLPPGLNDPRWDFSPKEESEEPHVVTLGTTSRELFLQWADGLCGVFAFFAIWGLARDRYARRLCDEARETPRPAGLGRRLLAVYLALFSLVLARHALKMGYLSDRHTLTLVAATIPWAASGTFVCARGIATKLRWGPRRCRTACVAAVVVLMVAGVVLQTKHPHASRWGHWAAGRWLAAHAKATEAVLDTRGWAAFISGRPSYDYWHVRQAFTDSHLAYIVVGTGELEARSRRAETLRAVLAYAATPVAEFPERRDGGGGQHIRVYRYQRPPSWEGLRR